MRQPTAVYSGAAGLVSVAQNVFDLFSSIENFTGDGAGILVGMPDSFLQHALMEEQNFRLPALGEFGIAAYSTLMVPDIRIS